MPLKKVGAMWLKEKNGKKYMSGQVSESIAAGQQVLMFRNTYKQDGDNKPDYTLNVSVDDDDQTDRRENYSQPAPPSDSDAPF